MVGQNDHTETGCDISYLHYILRLGRQNDHTETWYDMMYRTYIKPGLGLAGRTITLRHGTI